MSAPVIEGKPQTFGWVRYPEQDTPTHDAWECPDGHVEYAEKGREFIVCKTVRENPILEEGKLHVVRSSYRHIKKSKPEDDDGKIARRVGIVTGAIIGGIITAVILAIIG